MIGREDLAKDPRYLDREKRDEHEADEVNEMVAAWTRQHDKHEAMRILGAAGIPAGAVLDTGELLAEPTFEERGIIQTQQHPSGDCRCRPSRCASTASRQDRAGAAARRAHHEVFADWLGMSEGDVEALKRDRVL